MFDPEDAQDFRVRYGWRVKKKLREFKDEGVESVSAESFEELFKKLGITGLYSVDFRRSARRIIGWLQFSDKSITVVRPTRLADEPKCPEITIALIA